MTKKNCRWARERLASHDRLGLLEDERKRLESHLSACPECRDFESVAQKIIAVAPEVGPEPPSPLLERLRLALPDLEIDHARPALESAEVVRPAFEQAIRAGIAAAPRRFADLLPVALAEASEAAPETLAAARVAVLAELDLRGVLQLS